LWVKRNIAAFGGAPDKVTIAGESAGSISVSAQMASPLSKDLFAGAIGESGSLLGTLSPVPLSEAEDSGSKFAAKLDAKSLTDLRAIPASKLLEAAAGERFGRFGLVIDGYFLTKQPAEVFTAGEQAKVPLLVGWNSEEMNYRMVLGQDKPTRENYEKAVRKIYGERADDALKHYAAGTDEEVVPAATDLAGDRFIGLSTWRWADLHKKTGGKPVYRYLYARPRPAMRPEMGNAAPGLAGGVVKGDQAKAMRIPPARGAVHSAEIEYALGNLASNKVYAWTPDDYKVSEVMQAYFANFIKSGNPNAPGLPAWPAVARGDDVQVLHIDIHTRALPDPHYARYRFLDQIPAKKAN
jgi:para-nitrobenzyl esterase